MLKRTLSTVILLLLPTSILARPIEQSWAFPKLEQLNVSGTQDPSATPVFRTATSGTTFYGGTFWAADSMRWEAYENQLWTFDSGVGSSMVPANGTGDLSEPTASWVNPFKSPGLHATMEGWIGFDRTFTYTTYFRRVASTDPRWGAGNCVGSAGGLEGIYSFWVGLFQQEAEALCYAAGQGYGNAWSVCIERTFDYPGGNVTLAFSYWNNTEPDYDLTQVYCDTSGVGDVVEIARYDGNVAGSANIPLTPGTRLPLSPKPIKISFCVTTDGAWSDQDGLYPTSCGAFALDNVVLSGGISHTANFEAGDDGWHLSEPRAGLGGDWSRLSSLNDLPAPLAPCPCALSDSVLAFFDDHNGHNNFQDNLAASPWIDLKAYGKAGTYGKVLKTNMYVNLPVLNYIFMQAEVQWFPQQCPLTGKLVTSPWTSTGFFFFFDGTPQCTPITPGHLGTQIDFSHIIPPAAEQVRIGLGAISLCRFFANCSQLTNTSPWFDFVGLGVYGEPNVPYISSDRNGRAQDNFPANGALAATLPGRIDCGVVYGGEFQNNAGTFLGDTLVVRGAIGNAEVYVHFRVRPGPEINDQVFNSWYQSHGTSPLDPTFKVARCDTAEHFGRPDIGYWMTAYHEADPNFASHGAHDETIDPTDYPPVGGFFRLSHDIFPDNLLTPGSRIDYFFSANAVGATQSTLDPVEGPSAPYEMEILPSSMSSVSSSNCVLYVNHQTGSARSYIENGLDVVLGQGSDNFENTKWDRFDVTAEPTFGRPLSTDYGATVGQLLMGYRVILWDSGEQSIGSLTREDADVLVPWLTLLDFDFNSLYLSGNGLVAAAMNVPNARSLLEDLAGTTLRTACAAGSFSAANCPGAGAPVDLTPCVNLLPLPHAPVAGSGAGRSVNHMAQGNGCPDLRSFDVVYLSSTADYGDPAPDEVYSSPVKGARYVSISNDAAASGPLHYKTVVDGASVHLRRDLGTPCDFVTGGTISISERLREVLDYFGVLNGACPPRSSTGIGEDTVGPRTRLLAFSPNPFGNGALGRIRFSMAQTAKATIEIFDLQGRMVASVFDGLAESGDNEAVWDGRDALGRSVGSGVYFYRLRALDLDQSRKLVVMGWRN